MVMVLFVALNIWKPEGAEGSVQRWRICPRSRASMYDLLSGD